MTGILFVYLIGFLFFFVVLPLFLVRLLFRASVKTVTGQTPEALLAANKHAFAKFVEQSKAQ